MSELPPPVLTTPPNCACRGLAPQMREHTAQSCSVVKTDELNGLLSGDDARIEEALTSLAGEQPDA